MNVNENTIASISTALSPAGVGIIRISGKESFDIINKIFTDKNKKYIKISESHKVHYGFIYDKKNDKFLDEVLVLSFKSPRSFTGEDTIEIQGHGGVLVLQKILDLVIDNGARLAEPGEFTKRAFLNGRIDLSQAEAVIDLINSESQMSIDASISQLKGDLKYKIKNYKENLLEYTAYIEACLDDPEHMSIDGYKNSLRSNITNINNDIKTIIDTYNDGKIIKEGIKTVFLGAPNVGKSSILNVLLDEDRAIVSDIAGTTRDTIKENINIGGITLNIIDTAGIRDIKEDNTIEKIGIDKAKNEALSSDLILYVVDANDKNPDFKILDEYKNKKYIILYNKIDLYKGDTKKFENNNSIVFSTVTKVGLDNLKNKIKNMFLHKNIDFNNQIYISNLRHLQELKEASKSLDNLLKTINDNMPEDLYTIDLIEAITHLSYILGEEVSDDFINTIFSKFCMGK